MWLKYLTYRALQLNGAKLDFIEKKLFYGQKSKLNVYLVAMTTLCAVSKFRPIKL